MQKKNIFPCFIMLFIVSCSGMDASLKDGYYTAESAEFNQFGWKEYVVIRISGNRIIHVEYNAFNSSGFLQSWDMDYMRVMNAAVGTYPNAYSRVYGEALLGKQDVQELDCVSGATHSYKIFLRLAEAVFENARTGNTEIRLVSIAGIN